MLNISLLVLTCEDYITLSEDDFDEEIFLKLCLGDKRQPLEYLIPFTLLYICMFITGILGNILVIYVIFYHKNLRSPTNAFLVSLAVSDISLLFVGLPNDLHIFWQQYPWLFGTSVCKIRAMVSEMTSNSSVLTIVAFTIERYIAICHPLQSYKISSLSRSNKLITYIWIVSILASIPYAYFTQIHYMKNPHSNQPRGIEIQGYGIM
ncbi:neuropeptides capa receptor [Lepeophtheirus salmonis]|uniref:neuropeptides capa receptor n=1 Tax=Lepeophtheirus salmonis TaxID=72036 RepID=UPI001AEB7C70|nr:neuropeptides capa receptor-like [Lepeophtheirus salmonis]